MGTERRRPARQGVRFTDAYSASPVCSPIRGAIISGDGDPKDPAAGGPAFWPEHQGFDVGGCGLGGPPTYFDPYRIPAIQPCKQGEYLTDRLAAETVSFMTAHRHKPLFVCLWTYNPHYPFEAPEELVARYRGQEGPGLKNPVYGPQIEATDRPIGTVLEAIDRLGLAARTLVLFTSDNGGWEGTTDNRPLRSSKGDLYEGGIDHPLAGAGCAGQAGTS